MSTSARDLIGQSSRELGEAIVAYALKLRLICLEDVEKFAMRIDNAPTEAAKCRVNLECYGHILGRFIRAIELDGEELTRLHGGHSQCDNRNP